MTSPHWARPAHHELPRGTRLDGAGHDGSSLNRRPKQSTAPAGLWAPAPEVVVEKVAQPKRQQRDNLSRQRPCGSETAAKRHRRNKEVDADGQLLCAVCLAGRAARRTTDRKPKTVRPTASGERCGSRLGYDDHQARGEETCQPCRIAMAADARRRYANRAAALNPPTKHPQCGSTSGRAIHRRRGEKVCYLCREARNAADRAKHNGEGAAA